MLALIALVATACENTTPEAPPAEENLLSAAEFGQIIRRGEQLYSDLILPGTFILQNAEEQELIHRDGRVHFPYRVLPSSGFETIADIRAAFGPYFTAEMVDWLLSASIAFYEEADGNLYFFPYWACGSHWFWEDADFQIIEQDGNLTIVEVIVPGTGEGMEWIETIRYTFWDNRISEPRERIFD